MGACPSLPCCCRHAACSAWAPAPPGRPCCTRLAAEPVLLGRARALLLLLPPPCRECAGGGVRRSLLLGWLRVRGDRRGATSSSRLSLLRAQASRGAWFVR